MSGLRADNPPDMLAQAFLAVLLADAACQRELLRDSFGRSAPRNPRVVALEHSLDR